MLYVGFNNNNNKKDLGYIEKKCRFRIMLYFVICYRYNIQNVYINRNRKNYFILYL